MRRLAGAMALLALLAAGCGEASRLDRGARVEVRGQVLRADGAAAPEAAVGLSKDLGFAEFMDTMFTVFSFGMPCLMPEPPDLCRDRMQRGAVDGDGRYRFELSGSDAQSFFGLASTMNVTGALPATEGWYAGPSTSVQFRIQTESLDLPPFRFWEPAVEVRQGGSGTEVHWSPFPPEIGPIGGYAVQFTDGRGQTVWARRSGGPFTVDPRVLEDMVGGVGVLADGEAVALGTTVDLIYRSGQRPVQGPGVPPSRGAGCIVFGEDGGGEVHLPQCPLTDGDFAEPMNAATVRDCDPSADASCRHGIGYAVVIDLAQPSARSLLVLRGARSEVLVDWSDDLANWRASATLSPAGDEHLTVPLAGVTARYLRLRAPFGPVGDFREVSIW